MTDGQKAYLCISGMIILGVFGVGWGGYWVVNGFVTGEYLESLMMALIGVISMLGALVLGKILQRNTYWYDK